MTPVEQSSADVRAPLLSPADIDYAVRALLMLPVDARDDAAELMIRTTLLAERLRQSGARSHPVLGNGTLSASVSRWPMRSGPAPVALDQARALASLSRAVIRVCR